MGRNSAICTVFAATMIVAGCDNVSGLDTDPPKPAAPATSTATAATTPPSTPAPAATTVAPAGALLPCPDKDSGKPLPDCTLQSTDSADLGFVVRRTGTGENGTLTIAITTANGTVAQTITEKGVDAARSRPELIDTDADGREELILPLATTPSGTRYAVYHATGTATEFTRSGEFTGTAIDYSPDGFTVTSADLPANKGRTHTFWTYESDKLVPAATVEVHTTPKECVLSTPTTLSLTPYATNSAARTHFCAQPAAAN
ncbi:hypothetical protein ACFVUS_05205 [Nocardia sp. NPDC058058]|uniref:hypothetical protein n=1 Tax=Nocardia sp. NPDC058058 TaxID=3346317 RepID=UPI0036D9CB62